MSGMFPDNHVIEVFGEQVSWPGVGPDGKFTNGSFSDPMVKPSFIPAETLNLIIENLQNFIAAAGRTPNNIETDQLVSAMQAVFQGGGFGAGLQELIKNLTPDGFGQYQEGRNLLELLGVATPAEAMNILCARLNNGASAAIGEADFSGLQIGDYIDGIDLSAIPAENGGDAGQAWNNTYKNNRIVLSGFNTYKGIGSIRNNKNHLLFTFRDCPIRKRMNATNDNTGGYVASELRAFLEGVNGDGTGDKTGVTTAAFMNALKAQIGDHLYTMEKSHSKKSSSAPGNYTVFPPSELEVIGHPDLGDEGVYMRAITSPAIVARSRFITNVHFPIFAKSGVYWIKRYNGVISSWFTQTPHADGGLHFVYMHGAGIIHYHYDEGVLLGISPAFCVA